MSFEDRISSLIAKYKELKEEVSKPFDNQAEYIKISKEIAEMDDYINLAEEFKKDFDELQNLSELLKNTHHDSEMSNMIADELHIVRERMESEKEELKLLNNFEAIILIPRVYPIKTKLLPDYKIDWTI